MRIGLDIDGTSAYFLRQMTKYMIEYEGFTPEQLPMPKKWALYDEWGMTHEEFVHYIIRGVRAKEVFWRADPVEGSLEFTKELYRDGHEIVFITARDFPGAERDTEMATYYWLDFHGYPYHEVIIDHDKSRHNLDVLFDDSVYNCWAVEEVGGKGVLFDLFPHDDPAGLDTVSSWEEIYEYVNKMSMERLAKTGKY